MKLKFIINRFRLVWMIKSQTNDKFYFWVEEYGFLMYTTNNKLYLEVKSQSMLPAGKNKEFKHLKFRIYVGDEADFLRKVKNINLLYFDRYENYTETLILGEQIRRFFDPSLKEKYDVLNPQYKITILHEEAFAKILEMIDNMSDLYNLSTPLYYTKYLHHNKKLFDSLKKSGDSDWEC